MGRRARLSPALWRPEGRRPGDAAVWSHPLNQKTTHSLPTPTLTQAASCGHCFPFFLLPLSPFSIFKENSRPAEGAQLRWSLAAQRAQQGAAGPRNPFPGKMWAAGQILKLLRRQRGPSLEWASQGNSGHLMTRGKGLALIPNSQNPKPQPVIATVSPRQLGRFAPALHILWGPCPALPFSGPDLRRRRKSGRAFQTSKGRRSESFSVEPSAWMLCVGHCSPDRKQARPRSRGNALP